jgi:hypothetical protein
MFRKKVAEVRCVFSIQLSANLLHCLRVTEIHLVQDNAPGVRSAATRRLKIASKAAARVIVTSLCGQSPQVYLNARIWRSKLCRVGEPAYPQCLRCQT